MGSLRFVRRHSTLVAFSLSLAGSSAFVACGSDSSSTADIPMLDGGDASAAGGFAGAMGQTGGAGSGSGGAASGGAGGSTGGSGTGGTTGSGGAATGGAGGAVPEAGPDVTTPDATLDAMSDAPTSNDAASSDAMVTDAASD